MHKYEKKIIYSYGERDAVVQLLKKLMHSCHVFAFVGPLGAGKTTIIRDVLHQSGVQDAITSPTFTYVNEYENSDGQKFYHFDLYRIGGVDGFQEQGFDEYLQQPNSWTFIEWPEVISSLLQHKVCWLTFDYHDIPDKRIISVRCVE